MPTTDTKAAIVIRLVDGSSEQQELVLEMGRPIPPMMLGGQADWKIAGHEIADAHVILAWNGRSIYVATSRGQKALLDGFPLSTRWTEVRMPGELRFGEACLTIGRRAGPDDTTAPPRDRARRAHVHHTTRGAPRRLRRDDEATCPDEERVQAALRLACQSESTCIADVVIPPAARRPSADETVAPDSDRTLVAILVAPQGSVAP